MVCPAALSNNPLGHLNPAATYSINHVGTLRLAGAAKQVGSRALPVHVIVQPVWRGASFAVSLAEYAGTDLRNYRVDFSKLAGTFPDLIAQLLERTRGSHGLSCPMVGWADTVRKGT